MRSTDCVRAGRKILNQGVGDTLVLVQSTRSDQRVEADENVGLRAVWTKKDDEPGEAWPVACCGSSPVRPSSCHGLTMACIPWRGPKLASATEWIAASSPAMTTGAGRSCAPSWQRPGHKRVGETIWRAA